MAELGKRLLVCSICEATSQTDKPFSYTYDHRERLICGNCEEAISAICRKVMKEELKKQQKKKSTSKKKGK